MSELVVVVVLFFPQRGYSVRKERGSGLARDYY